MSWWEERDWKAEQNNKDTKEKRRHELNFVDNAHSCEVKIKMFKEKAIKEAENKAQTEGKEQEAKEKQRWAELEAACIAKEKEEEEVR